MKQYLFDLTLGLFYGAIYILIVIGIDCLLKA